jgi:hypothetical protein
MFSGLKPATERVKYEISKSGFPQSAQAQSNTQSTKWSRVYAHSLLSQFPVPASLFLEARLTILYAPVEYQEDPLYCS